MPEYGLGDKSPEQLEEEQFNQELIDSFKRAEATELEARRRQVAAEESIIRTAETLRQMSDQLQQIQDTQEAERQARIEAEQRTEISNRKQTTENRIWQSIIIAIAVLTLAATIFGVLK